MKKGAGLLSMAAAFLAAGCQSESTIKTAELGLQNNQPRWEVTENEVQPGVVETLRNASLGTTRRLENQNASQSSTSLSIEEREQVELEFASLAARRAAEFFPDTELHLVSVRHGTRFTYVTFEQTHQGRSVEEARLIIRMDSEGNWSTQSSTLVSPRLLDSIQFQEAAKSLGSVALQKLGPNAQVLAETQTVFVRNSKDGASATAYAAHRIVANDPQISPEIWLWIDQNTSELLAVHNPVAKLSKELKVEGTVTENHQGSGVFKALLPFVNIEFSNGTVVQANESGSVRVPEGVSTGQIRLMNEYMKIVDEKSPVTAAPFQIAEGEDTVNIDEHLSAEVRTIYYWLNVTRKFVREELNYNGLQYQMLVQANYGERFDNAFFMPMTLSLAFGQGDRFLKNTALSRDIIIHEFGHAFTHDVYGLVSGYEFSAMNEAMSDYLAATITNDPLIADGSMIGRNFMRTLENKMRYPESFTGQGFHNDGQLFSGAIWRLRKALGQKHADALFHEARLAQAKSVFEFYREMLKIEETKADHNHFTLNDTQRAIVRAFKAQGLGAPGVALAPRPAADLTIPWTAQGCFGTAAP